MKLEVVVIPVSDVDRAKKFYSRLGWRQDVTPPGSRVPVHASGSPCSVQFGANLTSAAPGSAQTYLIVSDIEAARDALVAAGVEVSEVFHLGERPGQRPGSRASQLLLVRLVQRSGRQHLAVAGGHDPASRAHRLGATSFSSASDLASAFRRAEAAHGEHEKRTGQRDENWPDWYAGT